MQLKHMHLKKNSQLNKQTILWSAMMNYAKYGENSSFRNKMSAEELNNVTSEELIDLIHN